MAYTAGVVEKQKNLSVGLWMSAALLLYIYQRMRQQHDHHGTIIVTHSLAIDVKLYYFCPLSAVPQGQKQMDVACSGSYMYFDPRNGWICIDILCSCKRKAYTKSVQAYLAIGKSRTLLVSLGTHSHSIIRSHL